MAWCFSYRANGNEDLLEVTRVARLCAENVVHHLGEQGPIRGAIKRTQVQ